jgi:hypothetical protein
MQELRRGVFQKGCRTALNHGNVQRVCRSPRGNAERRARGDGILTFSANKSPVEKNAVLDPIGRRDDDTGRAVGAAWLCEEIS